MQYAPRVECVEHLPEVEFTEDPYDVDLESSSHDSESDADSSPQQESSDPTLKNPTRYTKQESYPPQTDLQSKTKPTQRGIDRNGQPSLISSPVVTNEGRAPKSEKERP